MTSTARRFVLYYRGPAEPDPEDIRKILALQGVRLLDHEIPRLLLVEGPEDVLTGLISNLRHWTLGPERKLSCE